MGYVPCVVAFDRRLANRLTHGKPATGKVSKIPDVESVSDKGKEGMKRDKTIRIIKGPKLMEDA